MIWVFWISTAVVVATYLGYPIWLYFRTKMRPKPVRRSETYLSVSIIVPAYNEERVLARKLESLWRLNYPPEQVEVIVVSDGSTDGTRLLLEEQASNCPRLRALYLNQRRGKAAALNAGIREAKGELLVLTDARQWLDADAIGNLIANFADPEVGCASGELMLGGNHQNAIDGEMLKWRIENKIREWEGASGSVLGALGAFYGVRRELVPELPEGIILDDMFIPLHVARQGKRVVFETTARAWDDADPTLAQEFRRKVRTLTGNYQLLKACPWLLTRDNPLRLEFVCHKLLRLVVPFALVAVLASSFGLGTPWYRAAFYSQLVFYVLAVLGIFLPSRWFVAGIANIPLTFLVLNTAALAAFFNFLIGKKPAWAK